MLNFLVLQRGLRANLIPIFFKVVEGERTTQNALQFNIQNNISTFVPKQLRGTPSAHTPQQLQDSIEIYDLGFKSLIEDFNVYELDSKQVLSIKTTLAQVSKSKLFNNSGEPIYKVATSLIAKAEPKGIV